MLIFNTSPPNAGSFTPKILIVTHSSPSAVLLNSGADGGAMLVGTDEAGLDTDEAGLDGVALEFDTDKAGLDGVALEFDTDKAGLDTDKAGLDTDKAGLDKDEAVFDKVGLG
jgi:hypothetical protein